MGSSTFEIRLQQSKMMTEIATFWFHPSFFQAFGTCLLDVLTE
jgi:hypothetical protein